MINWQNLKFEWEPVGSVSPGELTDSRKQLHHSIQLIAAAGKALVPQRPDDSHTSLHWNEDEKSFEGETIGHSPALTVGLSPANLILYTRQEDFEHKSEYALKNNTLDSALSWLKSNIESRGVHTSKLTLKMHYEIPDHAVGDGRSVKLENPDHFDELGRYFANAHNILTAIKLLIPSAGNVRCWPHHFDIATLIRLDNNSSTQGARSIGLGLSPGDGEIEAPYFYILPWPFPEDKKLKLPELPAGKWRKEGWTGALLPADDFGPPADQTKTVSSFLRVGISACAEILKHRF